jgi:hypothetical protein
MARAHVIRNGLGAQAEECEVELGIREGRARVRRLVKGPWIEDASKHWHSPARPEVKQIQCSTGVWNCLDMGTAKPRLHKIAETMLRCDRPQGTRRK